jgi:hypothetical protein
VTTATFPASFPIVLSSLLCTSDSSTYIEMDAAPRQNDTAFL